VASVDATAVAGGARLYRLPGERAYPEGIAYDTTRRVFYTGSLADGALFRGDVDSGVVTVFSPARTDGRATVLGMEVDAARRRLWLAGGAAQRMYVYDLDTARLVRQYVVPAGNPASLINDVSVTPEGDAYFTDTQRPVLWKISGGQDGPGELEPWLDLAAGQVPYGPSANLNGIVSTPDGTHLISVHFRSGKLFRFTVASRATHEIELSTPVQNGDGLALDGTTLFVVASGKITRVALTPDYTRGTTRDTFGHPSFMLPTTLRKVGDRLLVINSQLDTLAAGRPVLPFTITSVPIPP